jgi:hypothetical protein
MSDKPRSIIVPNEPATAIVAPDKAILTPDEAKERIEQKAKRRFSTPNKYNISRDEAVNIAVQIGQEVYDQLRAEHALSMGELQTDLRGHFRQIKEIVATNILDLQRRSFSYRLRRDFAVDRMIFGAWLREKWAVIQSALVTDWDMALAWLELHGLKVPIAELRNSTDSAIGHIMPDQSPSSPDEHENIGAPTELPEPPEVARTFALSDGGVTDK